VTRAAAELLATRREAAGCALPRKLHECTLVDLDGNLLRVFYDFAWETRDK